MSILKINYLKDYPLGYSLTFNSSVVGFLGTIFSKRKINTKNTHGTGCTLSSAIATYYSCGKTLKKSCEMAIKYVNHSIGTGPRYGKGHGPINHLSTIKINKKFK